MGANGAKSDNVTKVVVAIVGAAATIIAAYIGLGRDTSEPEEIIVEVTREVITQAPIPPATDTPTLSPTPSTLEAPKIIDFTVEPSRFIQGQVSTVRLEWSTEGADSVTISEVGEVDSVGSLNQSAPTEDVVFELVAENLAGIETSKVPLEVLSLGEFVQFEPSQVLTSVIERDILSWIATYLDYFYELGFLPEISRVIIFVDPELQINAYYDGERIVLGEPFATDRDVVLREYTHRILIEEMEKHLDDLVLIPAIESGLADYFPASSQSDPKIAETVAPRLRDILGEDQFNKPYVRNLVNNRKFSEVQGNTYPTDEGEIWAGAFWDIRLLMGKASADKLLLSTWLSLQPPDLAGDTAGNFVRKLLELEQALEDGRYASEIQKIFRDRELEF